MVDYCNPSDLYNLGGLQRGSLPNAARLLASASTTLDALFLDGHGFETNDPLTFRADANGALPAPLVAGVSYFVIARDDNSFQLAAAVDGVALSLTTAGARTLVIAPLPIAGAIAYASRVLDDMIPAHVLPVAQPIPELLRMTCAEIAVYKLLVRSGSASSSMAEQMDRATRRIERWARGVPMRGPDAPASANLAQTGAAVAVRRRLDARGWGRYGGTDGGCF